MKALRIFGFAALCLAGTACTPTLQVTRWKAGELAVPKGTRVAVVRFDGNEGSDLAADIQRSISEGQYLELVDRDLSREIQSEHRRLMSGEINNDGSVEAGGLLAVQVMVTGQGQSEYDENRSSRNSTCTRYVNGKSVPYNCTYYTVDGRANYNASFKVVNTSTGKTISRVYRKADSDSNTAVDTSPPPIDRTRLISNCRRAIVSEFMAVITPTAVEERIELVEDGKLPQLKAGNKFAQQKNWDGAKARYMEAVATASTMGGKKSETLRAKAHYALGIALMIRGEYNDAIEQLTTASNLVPESLYAGTLQRVREWQAEDEKLKKAGGAPGASDASAGNDG